jgi:hypothetical protein
MRKIKLLSILMSFKTLIYNTEYIDRNHFYCQSQVNIFEINLLFLTKILESEN